MQGSINYCRILKSRWIAVLVSCFKSMVFSYAIFNTSFCQKCHMYAALATNGEVCLHSCQICSLIEIYKALWPKGIWFSSDRFIGLLYLCSWWMDNSPFFWGFVPFNCAANEDEEFFSTHSYWLSGLSVKE